MAKVERKVVHAWLESPTWGMVELAQDWRATYLPPVSLGLKGPAFSSFAKVPEFEFARESGYSVNRKDEITFIFNPRAYPHFNDEAEAGIYLAGDFNRWDPQVKTAHWRLMPAVIQGEAVYSWTGPAAPFLSGEQRFKFVTGQHHWLHVPPMAPNVSRDDNGNVNYRIDPHRTGQHLFKFTLPKPVDLATTPSIYWNNVETVPLHPGDFFFRMRSDTQLGARVYGRETVFRLFAPRAHAVELSITQTLNPEERPHRYALSRRSDGVWEVALAGNLQGWYYWYQLSGAQNSFSRFDPKQRVLDPYAMATVGPLGPGIVVDIDQLGRPARDFKTPSWHDLVIVEAHVRDLVEKAPLELTAAERRGFSGLTKWVESEHFYLHELGVNAVELQPIQEADTVNPTEYFWGYMTANYFSPSSAYALEPEKASGLKEFQELVAAFHRRGMAVILDVVYNHVGEPPHLMFIDKLYYFEGTNEGELTNWSGCGNDLRSSAAMATRLIIDSCIHLVETFGVDGFRFDLAELVGLEPLMKIERALKRVKPDVILIAEPWSFRGHIAGALRDTGWASWNDGYRNFLRDYVRGAGSRENYEYYLKGSPWHFAKWPAQTVNYTESHDDRTWIDMVTENGDGNGHHPTLNDRKRTHLMAAILFASIGMPMISAGQDFLRSKHGVNNTYLRGDLNALDYDRIRHFPSTHAYFAGWIAFRRSEAGRLLRLYSRPSEGFFRFVFAPESSAAVTIYNEDKSMGSEQLLFAVNPTQEEVTIALEPGLAGRGWRQIANHERFDYPVAMRSPQPVTESLKLGPLSCGLWIVE